MDKRGFKKLVVWQKAKELVVMVYKVSEGGPLGHDYGLRDQIRRSLDDVVDR
ncbi:MAG: four helix bundle protein [Nitrospirae bacterium]|nr:four helix bundle protein [Nitrospirota bacterium]